MLIKLNDRAVKDATTFGSISSLGEMVFISKATASASASIEFTSGIDSTYKEYVFYFVNIHPSANSSLGFKASTNSGSSYRIGIESELELKLSSNLSLRNNFTLSSNKNKKILSKFNGSVFDFGKTNISFSPNLISSNSLIFSPNNNLMISFLSKYVGKQYMGNTDAVNSILDSYFVNDINFTYKIISNLVFEEIIFSGLVNNVFNNEYVSNGYYYTYDDTWSSPGQVITLDGAGYYPQATRNFLLGLTLKF